MGNLFVVGVLVAALVGGWPGRAAQAAPPFDDFSDPSLPVEVMVGQTFTIVLNANRTTGYSWELSAPLDEAVIRLAANNYVAGQPGLPGATGVERWDFEAVGPGTTTVALRYRRPFEPVSMAVNQVTFNVTVR